MVMRRIFSFLIISLLLALSVIAHDESELITDAESVASNSIVVVVIASALIAFLIIIAALKKKESNRLKVFLFVSICVVSIVATFYLAMSTILLNINSESNGPVHWHTDFEIWKCGENLDLLDPTGLSNRIGTSVFHEHGDQRIHVEGVVTNMEDVTLSNFIHFVGGELSSESFTLSTNNGDVSAKNGDRCPSGAGNLQAFLYRITNPDASKNTGFFYTQTKLADLSQYVPAPYANVPPGDCIILEFDVEKERTDKICETYRIANAQSHITEVPHGS